MTAEEEKQVEQRVRLECARIAVAESNYWRELISERHDQMLIEIGAMGAAANICSAILMGKTAGDHKTEIEKRDGGHA